MAMILFYKKEKKNNPSKNEKKYKPTVQRKLNLNVSQKGRCIT